MTQVRRVWAASVIVVAACIAVAGCRVDTDVEIRLADNGGGTVKVTLTLDREAIERLGGIDAAEKIPLDDLRAAGWQVSAVRRADDGGASIEVAHQFSDRDDLAAVLTDVFGENGAVRDPSITRARGWLQSEDRISVVVDASALRAGIANDAELSASLREAGLEPLLLEAQLTEQLRDDAHLSVEVRAPGGTSRTFTAGADGADGATTVAATSSRSHAARIAFAVLGVLAVVGAVLLLLWARRSARRPGIDESNAAA